MKGVNLTDLFISWCNQNEIRLGIVESRSGTPVFLNINNSFCYLKYSNLNSSGDYYFGFATKDVESNFRNSEFSIIVCGEGEINHVYIIPSRTLAGFLREGKPVGKRRAVYEEYQAKIFPNRNFEMTVTSRGTNPVNMRQFEVPLTRGEIVRNIG